MKTWWVLGYNFYYPTSDNFIESFTSEEEAKEFLEELEKNGRFSYDNYEIINIEYRL